MNIKEDFEDDLFLYHSGKTVDTYISSSHRGKRIALRTNRISADDNVIKNTKIPFKGRVANACTNFLKQEIHEKEGIFIDWIPMSQEDVLQILKNRKNREFYRGKISINQNVLSLEVEAIARRYNVGTFAKEFKKGKAWTQCFNLPSDLKEYDEFSEILFTPSIKKAEGHDDYVTFEEMRRHIEIVLKRNGINLDAFYVANKIENYTRRIYSVVSKILEEKGLRLVDIKVEFGLIKIGEDYRIILIDEISPDTIRAWIIDSIKEGEIPVGLDKDLVRREFKETGKISEESVQKTSEAYLTFARTVLPEHVLKENAIA